MEPESFDHLARLAATRISRGQLLKALAATGLAGVLPLGSRPRPVHADTCPPFTLPTCAASTNHVVGSWSDLLSLFSQVGVKDADGQCARASGAATVPDFSVSSTVDRIVEETHGKKVCES